MALTGDKMSRNDTTPFHLKVFYRVGSYHRLDEFAAADYSSFSSGSLPSQHVSLSVWPSCSLNELTHLLVAELCDPLTSPNPNVLPVPAVGTRLAFRLVYPDPTASRGGPGNGGGGGAPAYYTSKELGSIVIGGDGMGWIPDRTQDDSEAEEDSGGDRDEYARTHTSAYAGANGSSIGDPGGDPDRTLADARFVIGDFVSVAILPPGRDGEIAPASAARGDAHALSSSSLSGRPGRRHDADDRGMNGGRHADGRARRRQGSGGAHFGGIGGQLPRGDWRRGERLPPLESRGYVRGRREPRG